MQKITYCVIDDTALPLLFTLGAEMQIAQRLGSVDRLFDVFAGGETEAEREIRLEIEKDMTPEQIAARDAETGEPLTLMDVLPFTIATLARQGQLYEGQKATFTEDWVTLHARPADIEPMTIALMKAIEAGLAMQHQSHADGEEDMVKAAIEKTDAAQRERPAAPPFPRANGRRAAEGSEPFVRG